MSERKPAGEGHQDNLPEHSLGRRETIKALLKSGGVLATAMTLPASWSPAVVEVLARGTTTTVPPTTTTGSPTTTTVPPTTTTVPPTTTTGSPTTTTVPPTTTTVPPTTTTVPPTTTTVPPTTTTVPPTTTPVPVELMRFEID